VGVAVRRARSAEARGARARLPAHPPGALLGIAIKFGAFTIKFFGIFISVGGYALLWGWKFGIGIVLMILVHEMGHFLEARRQGLHPSLPVFVPFLGAYVAIKEAPGLDPFRRVLIALAGPFAGGLGTLAVWATAESTDTRWLFGLAYTSFFLNLINLVPVSILDGGQTWSAIKELRAQNGGYSSRAGLALALYLGLAAALALAMWQTHIPQDRL
jgi:Zn-dependent protease